MSKWQPIETASKDEVIDIWTDSGVRVTDAFWADATDGSGEGWCVEGEYDEGWGNRRVPIKGRPTHWMPRPAPPERNKPKP